MAKPILFFDFDGMKFDTTPAHVKYINKRYRINSIVSDYINNPSLESVINRYTSFTHNVTREDAYRDLSKNFLESMEWHRDVLPFAGAVGALNRLAEKYELWTVTARQKAGLSVIQYLLDAHVPKCISGIHCVWEHLEDGAYNEISKREFIQNFPGNKVAFIDDSAKEILKVQDIIPSYLFDPSGANDYHPGIHYRLRSWKEIEYYFLYS